MEALGMIETIGMTPIIEASDAAVKSANVEILKVEKVTAGIMTLFITGDVSAVKSAVDAGSAAASRIGTVLSTSIIARTDDEISKLFPKYEIKDEEKKREEVLEINEIEEKIEKTEEVLLEVVERKKNSEFDEKHLERMKVKDLRRLARTLEGFSMDKEEIKFGRKQDLIEKIMNYDKDEVEA